MRLLTNPDGEMTRGCPSPQARHRPSRSQERRSHCARDSRTSTTSSSLPPTSDKRGLYRPHRHSNVLPTRHKREAPGALWDILGPQPVLMQHAPVQKRDDTGELCMIGRATADVERPSWK